MKKGPMGEAAFDLDLRELEGLSCWRQEKRAFRRKGREL